MSKSSHYQAVVLAGGLGADLQPLTNTTFKAVLPIGNIPMVNYVMHMLHKEGFSDVIIIARMSHADSIRKSLNGPYSVDISFKIETIPDDSSMGTADALRLVSSQIHVRNRLTSHFLVMPCDLICSVSLFKLFDVHRLHDATVTMMLVKPFKDISSKSKKSRQGSQQSVERNIIALSDDRVFIMTTETEALGKGILDISRHSAIHARRATIRRDLEDVHIYVFSKWVLKMIVERDTISSISRDLIPYLIRKQFAPPRRHQKDIYKYIPDLPREKASYLVPSVSHEDRIRCHALVLDEVHGLSRPNPKALYSCTRIKNLALYKDVNHGAAIDKGIYRISGTADIKESGVVRQEKQYRQGDAKKVTLSKVSKVSMESFVGDHSIIEEGVAIHMSVIGHTCSVGEKTVIRGSVIMNNVSIGRNCDLTNVCICDNAKINDNCRLKNCNVAPGHVVPEGTIEQDKLADGSRSFI
eukprot:gene10704-2801_t